jgi:glycogen(starch) synthase
MKVLMTADTLGGVWTYAGELAQGLAARGAEVIVAAMGRAPDPDQLTMMAGADVVSREGALEWMPDAWEDVEAAGEWLLDLEDDVRPDVVHLNGYVHAALPWRAAVMVVAHSDVLSWFEAVRGVPAPPEWDRYRDDVERGLRAAEMVVAPTAATLAALERHFAFAAERVVVPNGRRLGALPARKHPLVVATGRAWDEAKNVAALERIAPALPWPLLVLGEGSRAGRVSNSHIETALARASIFALPARYEPFGLAALEAALSGCALVLGDIPTLREVWGDAALFVDPSDDDAIERTLLALMGDDERRRDFAAEARARASLYTPELMAARYLELYEGVAAARREPERV